MKLSIENIKYEKRSRLNRDQEVTYIKGQMEKQEPVEGGEEERLVWMLLEEAHLSTQKEEREREKPQGHRVTKEFSELFTDRLPLKQKWILFLHRVELIKTESFTMKRGGDGQLG